MATEGLSGLPGSQRSALVPMEVGEYVPGAPTIEDGMPFDFDQEVFELWLSKASSRPAIRVVDERNAHANQASAPVPDTTLTSDPETTRASVMSGAVQKLYPSPPIDEHIENTGQETDQLHKLLISAEASCNFAITENIGKQSPRM